jgi:polyisoprenoid-binding protein YceI
MSTEPSAVATASAAGTWTIDPVHSHVEFSVRHLMISTVKGRFAGVQGTAVLDEAQPGNSKVEVTIDVRSIDTHEPDRDTHLRSADFFEIEKFSAMTYRSTRVEKAGDDRYRVTGDLTIRDQTRPVALDVTLEGKGKDPWGGDRMGFSATARIKRSDFGLKWNQLLEAGGVAVGDEVKIAIDVELVKQG